MIKMEDFGGECYVLNISNSSYWKQNTENISTTKSPGNSHALGSHAVGIHPLDLRRRDPWVWQGTTHFHPGTQEESFRLRLLRKSLLKLFIPGTFYPTMVHHYFSPQLFCSTHQTSKSKILRWFFRGGQKGPGGLGSLMNGTSFRTIPWQGIPKVQPGPSRNT